MIPAERRPGGGARRSGNRLCMRPSKMLRRCVQTAAGEWSTLRNKGVIHFLGSDQIHMLHGMHNPGYVQGVELLSCDVQEEESKERARAAVRQKEQANEEALKLKQQQSEQERQADAQIAGHCHGTPSHHQSSSVIYELSCMQGPMCQSHSNVLT